ncbi:hypothetical protein F5Y07DRAFT_85498 [Xylaria sp. FL0933]|nr:hypothetical protein F5Y07DRAFT_85498 [Xylaria sp. FL0933]
MSNAPADPFRGHSGHISEHESDLTALTAVFIFVATMLTIFRFPAREFTPGTNCLWYSWAIFVSLLATIAFLILVVVGTVGVPGYHIDIYSREQLTIRFELSLSGTMVYNISLVLSLVSILSLCKRIYSMDRELCTWIQAMQSFLITYLLAALFGVIPPVDPIEPQWEKWSPGVTIQNLPFYMAILAVDISIVVGILANLESRVWKRGLSSQKRLFLFLDLAFGGLMCIERVIRTMVLLTIKIIELTSSVVPTRGP